MFGFLKHKKSLESKADILDLTDGRELEENVFNITLNGTAIKLILDALKIAPKTSRAKEPSHRMISSFSKIINALTYKDQDSPDVVVGVGIPAASDSKTDDIEP